ncbi:MAG: CHAD domain-containing protein, partial [Nannocystaceae bacterium]|nr:CHAD domain-containing protein [Nannocystaceae bacterium]
MANRSLRARARALAQRAIEALLRTPVPSPVRPPQRPSAAPPGEDHAEPEVLAWSQAARAHLQRYRDRMVVGPTEAFDDAEAIRRRRAALRRLRTVLVLAGPPEAMAEADKPLRRLARELGAVRDGDVALAAVREHGRAAVGTLEQAALDELEAKLARRRRRARDR